MRSKTGRSLKKFLSLLLTLSMVLGMLPTFALATVNVKKVTFSETSLSDYHSQGNPYKRYIAGSADLNANGTQIVVTLNTAIQGDGTPDADRTERQFLVSIVPTSNSSSEPFASAQFTTQSSTGFSLGSYAEGSKTEHVRSIKCDGNSVVVTFDVPTTYVRNGYTVQVQSRFPGESWYGGGSGSDSVVASFSLSRNNESTAYVVTYNGNGADAGTTPANDTVLADGRQYTVQSDVPTRAGHNFLGWKNGDTLWQPGQSYNISSDITLTAEWQSAYSYTVTYDDGVDDGSVDDMPDPLTTTVNTNSMTLPEAPTREDYDFLGWHDGKSLYDAEDSYTLSGDVTFTAKWQPVPTYTVTYSVGSVGATAPVDNNAYKTDATISLQVPTNIPDGYVFKGWNDGTTTYSYNGSGFTPVPKMAKANITLTAVWAYDFTIEESEGGVGEGEELNKDNFELIINVQTTDKVDDEVIEAADEILGKAKALYFTADVIYTDSYGNKTTLSKVKLSAPYTVEIPVSRFVGGLSAGEYTIWHFDEQTKKFDLKTVGVVKNDVLTFSSQYFSPFALLINPVTLTFLNEDGFVVAPEMYVEDATTFNLPLPTANAPEGKVFDHWFEDADKDGVEDSGEKIFSASGVYSGGVTANTTFVAVYRDATGSGITVTYDAGAVGVYLPVDMQTPTTVISGDDYTIPAFEPTREGYTFGGWSPSVNVDTNDDGVIDGNDFNYDTDDDSTNDAYRLTGTDTIYGVSGNIVLTAVWNAITYHNVIFKANGSGVYDMPENVKLAKGETLTLTDADMPGRDGYNLIGWHTSKTVPGTGTPAYGTTLDITMGTADIVLYAVWEKIVENVNVTYPVDETGADISKNATDVPVVETVVKGSTQTFYVTLAEGYDPASLSVKWDGVPLAPVRENGTNNYYYTFVADKTGEITVSEVSKYTYTVTLPVGDHFIAEFDGTPTEPDTEAIDYVVHGADSRTFTITPVVDWKISAVYANGEKLTELSAGSGTYQVKKVTANTVITVAMEEVVWRTLKFFLDDSGTFAEVQVADGTASYTLPKVPAVEGYTVTGWYNNPQYDGSVATEVKNVTGDMNFYAKRVANTYEINYFAETGVTNVPAATNKVFGKAATLSAQIPVREGYDFLGWATSKGAAEPNYKAGDTFSGEITANVDLYAVWQVKTFTITLPSGTGYTAHSVMSDIVEWDGIYKFTVKVDRAYSTTVPTVIWTKADGSFGGTLTADPAAGTKNTEDGSITYQYVMDSIKEDRNISVTVAQNKTYTVSFYTITNDTGATPALYLTQEVEDTYLVDQPADPVMEGYTFKGWYKTSDSFADANKFDFTKPITTATQVYGYMEKNTYNVLLAAENTPGWTDDFVDPADSASTSLQKINVAHGATVKFQVKVLEGYDASNLQVGVNGKLWTPVSVTASVSGKDTIYTYEIGSVVGGVICGGVTENLNITVIGVARKTVKITYNGNAMDDVKGVPSVQTINYWLSGASDNSKIINQSPTRVGYEFLGWSTDSEADEADTGYTKAEIQAGTEAVFTTDTTLYAVWEASDLGITLLIKDDLREGDGVDYAYEGEEIILQATLTENAQGSVTFYKRVTNAATGDAAYIAIGTVPVNGGKVASMTTTAEDYVHDNKGNPVKTESNYRWFYKAVFTPANEEGYQERESVDTLRVYSKAISWKLDKPDNSADWTNAANALKIYTVNADGSVGSLYNSGSGDKQMEANTAYWLEIRDIYELDGYTSALTVGEDYVIEWQYHDGKNDWVKYTTITDSKMVKIKAEHSQYAFRALVKPADTAIFDKAAKYDDDRDLIPNAYMDYLISQPTKTVAEKKTITDLVILDAAVEQETVKINGAHPFDNANSTVENHLAQFEGKTVTLKATVKEIDTDKDVKAGYVKFYRYVDGTAANDELLNTTQVAVDEHGVATFEVAVKAYDDASAAIDNVDKFYAVYEKHETWDTSCSVAETSSVKDAPATMDPDEADIVYVKSTELMTPVITSTAQGYLCNVETDTLSVSGNYTETTYAENLVQLKAGIAITFALKADHENNKAKADWSVVALDGRTADSYDIQWLVKTGNNEVVADGESAQVQYNLTESKTGDSYRVKLTGTGAYADSVAYSNYAVIGSKQDVTVVVTATPDKQYQLNDVTLTAVVTGSENPSMKPSGNVTFYYKNNDGVWTAIKTAELIEDAVTGKMVATIATDVLPVRGEDATDDNMSFTMQDVDVTAVYEGDASFNCSKNGTYDDVTKEWTVTATDSDDVTEEVVTVYSSVVYVDAAQENKAVAHDKNSNGIQVAINGELVANEVDVALTLQPVYTRDQSVDEEIALLEANKDYTIQWQILENASQYNQSGDFSATEKWNDIVGATGVSYTIASVAQDAAYRAVITVTDEVKVQGSWTELDQCTADEDVCDGRKVYYSNVLVVGAGQATVTTAITTSKNANFNEEGIVEGETVTIHTMVAGAAMVTPISKLTVSINDQVIAEETTVNGYTPVEWKPTAPGYYTLKVKAESNNGYEPQEITRTLIVRDDDYTLTATNVSKVYNGKAQGIDWSLTGIGIEDTLAQQSVVVHYYQNGKMVEPTQAGTYTYELILPASAYWTATATKDGEAGRVKMETGTFTIKQREVSIADLVAQTKVYDGNATANLVEIVLEDAKTLANGAVDPAYKTGVINGDSVYAVGDGVLSAATAGEQTLSAANNVVLAGPDAANYKLTNGYSEVINVQRNQIKGSIAAATYKFGTKQIPADDIIMIQQNGAPVDYVVTYYYHNGDGVEKVDAMNWYGKYTVIAAPADQNNYKGGASQVVYVADAAVDATPTAPVSTLIVLSNTAEVFGGSNSGVNAVATNGTAVTVEYYVNNDWTTDLPANAGRYMVKATSGADTTYGIYTVVKAHPVLKLTATGDTYDSDRYDGAPVLTGGTAEYYTWTGGTIQGVSYDAPIDAGTYVVTAHVGETDNYTAHEVSAVYTIAPAPLTITADDLQRWQYGAIPDMVATFEGLADQGVAVDTSLRDVQIQPEFIFNDVDGDNQPNYNNSAMDQVGLDYEIKPVNALARNYKIAYVPGNFSVTKEDPRAALAIHGMIDNADLNTNIAYYGDVIQLYAYGNYSQDKDSSGNAIGTGVYNPSSLIEWSLNCTDELAEIDEKTGLLTINGVGTFTVTLTRGSGDAAISTSIEITALKQEVKVVVPNDDKVFNNTELPHEGTLSALNSKGVDVTAAITKGNVTRKPIGSVYETGVVAGTDDYYQSETYRGLFTVNDREVVVKPNEISVVYGNTLDALSLSYTEENTATLPALKGNVKLASIRDAYVNLDVYDGYEILVTGTEELNYNVKYVTDQAAADVKVTALDLTVYTGTLDEEVGKTSGSPNYVDGYPANGEMVDASKVLDGTTVRMYGEPNWVMDYAFETVIDSVTDDVLVEGDSLADLLSFNKWAVNYEHGIGAPANVRFNDKTTKIDSAIDYIVKSDVSKLNFRNYTESFNLGIQNIYQRPVDLVLTNNQSELNIYFDDILASATDVDEDALMAIIEKNIKAIKPDGMDKGGLAELLNHKLIDLKLAVEEVPPLGADQRTFVAHIYIGNDNYYLNNGENCTSDNTGSAYTGTNKSDRCYKITVNILDQRLTVKYTSLTNTSADIVLYSGSVPTYASSDVTYYIYEYVAGQENYSWYAANATAVRSKVMTKDNSRTGRYYVNFDYIPNTTYRVFAVASGYTVID